MYELKTRENDRDVLEFIEAIEHDRKREDALKLLDIFTKTTGYPAKMWGTTIIGFGSYHYKYASGHEGDAPLVGFSPRKARLVCILLQVPNERNCYLVLVSILLEKLVCILTN